MTSKTKEELYNPWPSLVREARTALGETQLQFGRRFGFKSPTAISLIESGERDVPGRLAWWLVTNGHVVASTPKESSEVLRVTNFACSYHGVVAPQPACPKCLDKMLDSEVAVSQPPTTDNQDEKWKTIADFGDGVDLDELLKALDTQASELEDIRRKVRRIFANRTHKSPKIEVTVPKEMQKYKTAIVPYEPTVEKLVAAIEALLVEARVEELNNTIEICEGVIETWSKHAYSMESMVNDQLIMEGHPNADKRRRENDVTDRRAILLTSAIPKHLKERLEALRKQSKKGR